ncbi:MAG TPA: IS1595 family transposase [Candidatus Acidoferrales bacterium]|nr:IS1595 family transposase [Candidatus Acidoferrales bacterium]
MYDKNLNLAELIKDFSDESKCRAYIEELRWPKGLECPHCKSAKIYRIEKRNQLLCASCEYQFSVTVDTIFHDTHLPLWKWFLATMLLCESKKGMSACQIKTALGVSYKTAWYLCHRIRKAVQEVAPEPLGGTVEVDETYVGGKPRKWRARQRKQVVIGIRQRNGNLRLIRAADSKAKTVREIVNANIGGHVEVILTDESMIYPYALNHFSTKKHRTINHSKEYAHGDVHTNTVESAFSLLKRGIVGTWHKISAKHLPAYLDEMCFRFNNRKNPYLFRDTIMKLIQTPNLEYKELTAKMQEPAA